MQWNQAPTKQQQLQLSSENQTENCDDGDDDDDDVEDELEEEEDGFSFGAVGVKQPILLLFASRWDYSGGPGQDTPVYIIAMMMMIMHYHIF